MHSRDVFFFYLIPSYLDNPTMAWWKKPLLKQILLHEKSLSRQSQITGGIPVAGGPLYFVVAI
jgi:hypothetical protein